MMNATPATQSVPDPSDGTSASTWTSTPDLHHATQVSLNGAYGRIGSADDGTDLCAAGIGTRSRNRRTVGGINRRLMRRLTANADYLSEAETEEPLLVGALTDPSMAEFAALVYGASTAAFLSAEINDRQALDRDFTAIPPSHEIPLRPRGVVDAIETAVTKYRAPDLADVFEAIAGLAWNHLAWVPNHDWAPVGGLSPRDHHGSPAWKATKWHASFADDLTVGPTSDHYPRSTSSNLLYWTHILGGGFEGIRVISALAPETNVWVHANGDIVPLSEGPHYARRIQDFPGAAEAGVPTVVEDGLANPWREALRAVHQGQRP